MKMKLRAILERLAIVALPLIAMLCVAIPAFAADSKTNSMDVNLDGEVDVSDAVLLSRFVVEDPYVKIANPQDIDGDGYITLIDVRWILCDIAKVDPHKYEETTTAVTTTTTLSETTSTTTLPKTDGSYYMDKVILKYGYWVHDNNHQYSGDLHETIDSFFFNDGDNIWLFSFLSDEELNSYELIQKSSAIKGLHIWKPTEAQIQAYYDVTGYTKVPSLYEELPDAIKYSYTMDNGVTVPYILVGWVNVSPSRVKHLVEQFDGTAQKNPALAIMYDYNLNEQIDENDLMLMITHYMSGIPEHFGGKGISTANENYVLYTESKTIEPIG